MFKDVKPRLRKKPYVTLINIRRLNSPHSKKGDLREDVGSEVNRLGY